MFAREPFSRCSTCGICVSSTRLNPLRDSACSITCSAGSATASSPAAITAIVGTCGRGGALTAGGGVFIATRTKVGRLVSEDQDGGDVAAVVQRCEVHLGNRRAGDGLALERGEHGLDSSPQSFFYLGDRQVGWKGGHPVLQLGELVRNVERHKVTPRRQHLAELDVNRTEGLERLAQALSARLAGAPRSESHERIARKPRDELVQAEAQADRENAQQPR